MTTVDILMVEDNPGDVELTREALENSRVVRELFVVDNGDEALEFLRREGRFPDAPRPDLILLDLNLPRMSGHELLEIIKRDAALCAIPVIILSSSASAMDVLASYEAKANCYLTKPGDFGGYVAMLAKMEDFWFGFAKLPPKHATA